MLFKISQKPSNGIVLSIKNYRAFIQGISCFDSRNIVLSIKNYRAFIQVAIVGIAHAKAVFALGISESSNVFSILIILVTFNRQRFISISKT